MKTSKFLAALTMMAAIYLPEGAHAAKLMYATPVFETNGAVNGAARISCNALNLDKKPQEVRAEIIWGNDGSVVNDKTETIQPGALSRIAFWSNTSNSSFYCRFTVKSTKVRPYLNAYDTNWQTVFVLDAK